MVCSSYATKRRGVCDISVRGMNIDDRWTSDRGYNFATGLPVHFMFASSVGFLGPQIERRYFRWVKSKMAASSHFVNYKWPSIFILLTLISAMHHPIHFMYVHRPYFAVRHYNDC